MIRALFYRGRHHVHTARRRVDGELVTVTTIAARLRAEARFRANLADVAAQFWAGR